MTYKCVIGAVIAGFAAAASANFIVNGDFETSVPSNGTGGGWTSAHIDGAGGWRSSGGNPGGMFILNDNGNNLTDPTIMQTVTGLVVGRRYVLSGDYVSFYIGHSPPSSTDSFEVLVGGVVVLQAGPTPLHVWQHFSVNFIASDQALDIALRAEANGTDNDFGIDNIMLEVPSSGTMALLGLGGLATLRRRR